MAKALIHILRSRAGVTHVDASAGVGALDANELERGSRAILVSAGELSRSAGRLASDPIATGRRLRSGRMAVTRVMPAVRQDDGEDSIEIISLVMPAQGYAQAAGSLLQVVFDERFWRLARLAVSRGFELPDAACGVAASDERTLRAFDAWLAARHRGGVAVLPPADAQGILAMVAALDPDDRPECRWGIGVLGLDSGVDVCTISPIAGLASTRPIVQAALGQDWLSPEMEHALWHLGSNGGFPPIRTLVGAVRIESARRGTAGLGPRAATGAEPSNPNRTGFFLGAFGVAALVAALAIVLRPRDSEERSSTAGPLADAPRDSEPDPDPKPSSDGRSPRAAVSAGRAEADAEIEADADADGVRDGADCDPQDPRRSVLQVFYRDFDADGAGDPDESIAMKACMAPDAPAPPGYARRNDDLCDQNPALKSNGGCPCNWAGPVEDLDGNGVLDCLDDLDRDGRRLADDPIDDRLRLCADIAECFVRARRSFALAESHFDEVDAMLRNAALQKDLRGDARRTWEKAAVGGQLASARVAMRSGLWEIYDARRLAVFGDESFQPRSRLDDRQAAPDVFAVARPEQFEPLRLLLREVEQATSRYARIYARHIHVGRPVKVVRQELADEVLGEWLRNPIGPSDSLEAMKWVSGLLEADEARIEQEIRRLDDQLRAGRTGRAKP